jgi:hypothetical protein
VCPEYLGEDVTSLALMMTQALVEHEVEEEPASLCYWELMHSSAILWAEKVASLMIVVHAGEK